MSGNGEAPRSKKITLMFESFFRCNETGIYDSTILNSEVILPSIFFYFLRCPCASSCFFFYFSPGMKTVRIFSDRIRNRIRLEGLRSVRIKSGYPTSDTVSVSEYSNRIFIMSISNRILSDIVDTIRIRIRIRTEI